MSRKVGVNIPHLSCMVLVELSQKYIAASIKFSSYSNIVLESWMRLKIPNFLQIWDFWVSTFSNHFRYIRVSLTEGDDLKIMWLMKDMLSEACERTLGLRPSQPGKSSSTFSGCNLESG